MLPMPRRRAALVALAAVAVGIAGWMVYATKRASPARFVADRPSLPADSIARSRELIRVFTEITQRDPHSFTAFRRLAEAELALARADGDGTLHDRATANLRRSVELLPRGNVEAKGLLAAALTTKHRFEEAARLVEEAVLEEPSARGWLALIAFDAAVGLGNYAEAEVHLAVADAAQPGFAVWTRQSHVAFLRGDPSRARALLDRAARESRFGEEEAPAWLQVQIGILDLEAGRLAEARRHFERALVVMPRFHLALEHLAETYEAEGRDAEARPHLLEAIAVRPAPAYRLRLATIEANAGNAAKADELRQGALDELRQDAARDEAAFGRDYAITLLDDSDPAAATEALAILERDATRRRDIDGRHVLAKALHRAGRLDEARLAIDEALRFGTPKAAWHLAAAEIAEALGDAVAGARHRRTAREIDPHSES